MVSMDAQKRKIISLRGNVPEAAIVNAKIHSDVVQAVVSSSAVEGIWCVECPCVVMRTDGTESGSYTMVGPYYIRADTADEACKIAESWLPKRYELDDSASATPFVPLTETQKAHIRRQRLMENK